MACCGDSFLSVWLFSVWISYICSPTERTGILEITISFMEAYSAAGKTWFGWWLVEHYFSYHVDCPDGCVSGEPAGGG